MISMIDLWNRVNDYGKKFQSGIVTVSDFNGKVNESQIELLAKLLPFFETNDRVKNLLDALIKPLSGRSDLEGEFDKPDDFEKIASLSIGIIPCFPVQMNEISLCYSIPQREPSLEKRNAYFLTTANKFKLYPNGAHDYAGFYIKRPTKGVLAFTYEEDPESHELIQTMDAAKTKNLEWGENAFNLLLFMILVKYGISNREALVQEFGMLGLQAELLASTINEQKP